MSRNRVAVVGAGSWGTALADLVAGNGGSVTLWARDSAVAEQIRETGRNDRYLPGLDLDPAIETTTNLEEAVRDAAVVVSAIPSHAVRAVMTAASPTIERDAVVVSTSKGIENDSLKRMAEVLSEVLPAGPGARVAVLSGPSFAREVCAGLPTAVTVATESPDAAFIARETFSTTRFRVYTSRDVVGVELGGAVKNIVAIATGIADGIGFGDNARAALITRGLAEISRLGMVLGGDRLTFMGLAGLGDLVLTCTGDLSRNRSVGVRLGRGETLDEILSDMHMVAEGVRTTRSVRELAAKHEVEMPITEQVYEMLYDAKSPRVVLEELMARELKPEFERR